jgi:hypothetical protein
MALARLAQNIGRALAAGLVGTAAMTVSSTVEAKLRDRAPSSAPADAASKVLGIAEFDSDRAQQRFGTLVHWAYGTGWGAVRGVLRTLGLGPGAGTVGHLAVVWGSELVMLPKLGVAPPATQWGVEEVVIDFWHHLVYALATALAYERLNGREQ